MIQRITLVTLDRPGLLAEITTVLAAKGIDIRSIVAESVGTNGILHIDLDDGDAALSVLAAAGYNAVSDEVLLVRVEDRAGRACRIISAPDGKRRRDPRAQYGAARRRLGSRGR